MLRQPKFVWIFRAIAVELCCTFRTGHLPFIFNKSEVADMDHLVWSCSAATRARRVYGDRTLGCGGDQTGSWPSSQQSLANYKAVPPQVYSSTPATIRLSRGAVGSSVLCTQTARTAAAGVMCVTRQFLPAVNSLLTACPAGWLGVTVWCSASRRDLWPASETSQPIMWGLQAAGRTAAAQHNKCVRLQFLQSWLWN